VDGHGDFRWKDVSAAGRSGLSVEDYVIGGLDPDFRELLFAAGGRGRCRLDDSEWTSDKTSPQD
jgi:hypothetical protein